MSGFVAELMVFVGFANSDAYGFNFKLIVILLMAIGVILTGMGKDGAEGLLKMKQKGASTIGQEEASCVVYGMPKAAVDLQAVDKLLPTSKIPQTIQELVEKIAWK